MSEDQNQAASATLTRAEILLSMLSQQAAAARAEAQCAELRLLLAEARSGTHLRLERWLNHYATGESQPSEFQATALQSLAPRRSFQPPSDLFHTIDSWDQLLPFARERLRQNKLLIQPEYGSTAQDKLSPAHSVEQFAKPASRSGPAPATVKPKREPSPPRITGLDPKPAEPLSGAKHVKLLTEKFNPRQSALPHSQHRKQHHLRQMRGVATSFVAHSAIIVLMALITLRLPVPPASLVLETSASELSPQPLEISEPLAVEAPVAPSEPSTTALKFDAAENLTDVTATIRTAWSDLSVEPQPLSSAAMRASAASSTNALAKAMQANASFFGSAASGNCFCYVIDSSGSMRGGPWEAAKQELFKSLSSLTQKQRFYIVFFNRELSAIPLPGELEPAPRTLYATPENLAHARRWIDTLRIDSGGPPNAALELAISKEPDAIYLLTDGVTQSNVSGFLRKKNRLRDLIFGEQVRVPIHTIAFYSLAGQELLKQIAAENNGQFIYVADPRKQ